ncbi:hypothetical protein [Nocardia cyriacigeorgica]|uniref:hypothetical protein n=1 Tax=Nocardia cyriacigeorgica TaxID=135487 RepID=UPI001895AA97|nr:hypothetical protein [Nocardia cyriacigeorgica]MBF6454671.1 hypothetical protein [Nocardia cyriacigeorgica]MBF6477090.1 hypothetical protein [Nocardia cyriacigeorgica]MBF6552565.1 hypothetical protein [Nocardia cyriacigeorgica]
MSSLPGTWDLDLKTPVGTLHVRYHFTATAGGYAGTASSSKETVPLSDIRTTATANGHRVTWSQRVTKPMRLNLDFDVVITGATMSGHSRAGRLPRSTVTGRRIDP